MSRYHRVKEKQKKIKKKKKREKILTNQPKEEQEKKKREIHKPINPNIFLEKNPLKNRFLRNAILLPDNLTRYLPHMLLPPRTRKKKLHPSHKNKYNKRELYLILEAPSKAKFLKSAGAL